METADALSSFGFQGVPVGAGASYPMSDGNIVELLLDGYLFTSL